MALTVPTVPTGMKNRSMDQAFVVSIRPPRACPSAVLTVNFMDLYLTWRTVPLKDAFDMYSDRLPTSWMQFLSSSYSHYGFSLMKNPAVPKAFGTRYLIVRDYYFHIRSLTRSKLRGMLSLSDSMRISPAKRECLITDTLSLCCLGGCIINLLWHLLLTFLTIVTLWLHYYTHD